MLMQSRLIPSLSFTSAKEALAYYQEVFGAQDVYRFSRRIVKSSATFSHRTLQMEFSSLRPCVDDYSTL